MGEVAMRKVQRGDVVLFRVKDNLASDGSTDIQDGSVILDGRNGHPVEVIYLWGHHSRTDAVAEADIIAVVDATNGEYVKIGPYRGRFIILQPDAPEIRR